MLDAERLRANLPLAGLGTPMYFYPSIGSTNDRAAELAEEGAPEGTLVVAEGQTAGRGRGGRPWFTPPGVALAFSLVLRPSDLSVEALGSLSALGALAVVEGLRSTGVAAWIKWPNDVLIEGGKVAGVLVEASWLGGSLAFAVLGIGVNVRPGAIPPAGRLEFPATCVEAALGRRVDRQRLLASIVAGVARWYPRLGSQEIVQAWEDRLAYRGQMVAVVGPGGEEQRGRLLGLSASGSLRLESEEGALRHIGERSVHLRPIDSLSK